MRKEQNSLKMIVLTGLFAAIIYLGIFILRIPIPALVGRPFIHFGNTLAALAVLFLGLRNGGFSWSNWSWGALIFLMATL